MKIETGLFLDNKVNYNLHKSELSKLLDEVSNTEQNRWANDIVSDINNDVSKNTLDKIEEYSEVVEELSNQEFCINEININKLNEKIPSLQDYQLIEAYLGENIDNEINDLRKSFTYEKDKKTLNGLIRNELKIRIKEKLKNDIDDIHQTTYNSLIESDLHFNDVSYIKRINTIKDISEIIKTPLQPLTEVLQPINDTFVEHSHQTHKDNSSYFENVKLALENIQPINTPDIKIHHTKNEINKMLNEEDYLLERVQNYIIAHQVEKTFLTENKEEQTNELIKENEEVEQDIFENEEHSWFDNHNLDNRKFKSKLDEVSEKTAFNIDCNEVVINSLLNELENEYKTYKNLKNYLIKNDISLKTPDNNLCGMYINNSFFEDSEYNKRGIKIIEGYLKDEVYNQTVFSENDKVEILKLDEYTYSIKLENNGSFEYEIMYNNISKDELNEKKIIKKKNIKRTNIFNTKNIKRELSERKNYKQQHQDMQIDVYKYLKKLKGEMFTYYNEDFDSLEQIKYKNVIIHINEEDFNKPVYDIEYVWWMN